MEISTGAREDHPTPLPYDAALSPALAQPTPVASGAPVQGAVLDTTAMNLEQQRQGEADVAAAMHAGMAAENDRRHHYGQDILPQGAAYGDAMDLAGVGYPDEGTVGGLTLPEGFFYTPPREGAQETHTGPGNQ